MEDRISVLVIEDEEIWIKNLQLILKDFGFEVASVVTNAEDALTALSKANYDIILLDINLNGKSVGIELAKVINTLYKKPFIFITASDGHTLKAAAETQPSAYLTKPINPSSLYIAIQNALNNFNNRQSASPDKKDEEHFTSFFVKQGTRYKKIDWKDIAYLEAGKNYVGVFNAIDKTEYYIRSSLQKTLQHIIPKHMQNQFIQVNRAEVVQFTFILEVVNDEVKTAFKNFTVSELYSKELKNRLNIRI